MFSALLRGTYLKIRGFTRKGMLMKNMITNLVLLLLLVNLSGCSKRRFGPTPLREIGLQARSIMEDLQDFIIEVSSSDNGQCQMEVADIFFDSQIDHFSNNLFSTLGLRDVVNAINQVRSGNIEPETATLLRSLNVEPSMYRNDGVMYILENTTQTDINQMKSELDELEETWLTCLEKGSTSTEQEGTPARTMSNEEQVIKDLFVFWRDNMVTTIPDNSCQQQIKSQLSTNRTLISFTLDYYALSFDLFPTSGPTEIDEPDIDIRTEFEQLQFIWNGCEVEGEVPTKTESQNEAERLIKQMLTFWSENMIPLEDNNSCQQRVKTFIEENDTLSTLIAYLFNDNSAADLFGYFDTEETFLNDMRQNLGILQDYPCLSL